MNTARLAKLMWIVFEKFGISLISLLTFIVYAKILGPSELGIAVLALSVGQGLALIFGSLFEDALVQQPKLGAAQLNSAFCSSLSLSLSLCLVSVIILQNMSLELLLKQLILVSLIQLPLVSLSTIYVAQLRRSGAFKQLAHRTLFGRLVGAASGLYLVTHGAGAWSVIIQAVSAEVLGLLTLLFASNYRPKVYFNLATTMSLLKIGGPLALRRLSWDITVRGVPIVIGLNASASAVGTFALAWRLVEMPRSAISSGIISFALPVFSRNQHQPETLQTLFCYASRITCFLILPLFFGLTATAPLLIPLLFGAQWSEAIWVTQLLSLTAAYSVTRLYAPTLLTALARPNLTLSSDVFASLSCLLVAWWLAPNYAAEAGALGIIARSLIAAPFSYLGVSKALGLSCKTQVLSSIHGLVAASLMLVMVLALPEYLTLSPLGLLSCSIILGASCYLLSYSLLQPHWLSDLRQFVSRKQISYV
ncbi:oligosaccharide flippase family protein [Agarivorans sp.]|uniref:oligosaccharide flippase family protein n=1 Tax=Agarivorans sp. TaxID=1872412 RepID=UPI003D0712C4